jgi:hypothetical protein
MGPIEGNCPHGNYRPACKRCQAKRDSEVICDRCGREPGRIRRTIPYCWPCNHECTFTRADLAKAK